MGDTLVASTHSLVISDPAHLIPLLYGPKGNRLQLNAMVPTLICLSPGVNTLYFTKHGKVVRHCTPTLHQAMSILGTYNNGIQIKPSSTGPQAGSRRVAHRDMYRELQSILSPRPHSQRPDCFPLIVRAAAPPASQMCTVLHNTTCESTRIGMPLPLLAASLASSLSRLCTHLRDVHHLKCGEVALTVAKTGGKLLLVSLNRISISVDIVQMAEKPIHSTMHSTMSQTGLETDLELGSSTEEESVGPEPDLSLSQQSLTLETTLQHEISELDTRLAMTASRTRRKPTRRNTVRPDPMGSILARLNTSAKHTSDPGVSAARPARQARPPPLVPVTSKLEISRVAFTPYEGL